MTGPAQTEEVLSMKKQSPRKLSLSRETLVHLTRPDLQKLAGGGTLTYEGSCGPTTCPCPHTGR
jgi:hypothetical protein